MKQPVAKKINVIIYIISAILIVLIAAKLYNYHSSSHSPRKLQTAIPEHENDIVWGTDSAPVTMILYFSYQCKFCISFFKEIFPEIKDNYLDPGHVKLILKPVELRENADMMLALQSIVCMNKSGKFDKLHELLLYNYEVVYTEDFQLLVDDIIAANTDIAECLIKHNDYEYITANNNEFRELEFSGTPAFIINSSIYQGFHKYEKFEEIFQEIIK